MTTIDKLDISVYNLYAVRSRLIEQINEQWRLDQAGTIPPQTQITDFYPKVNELDLLIGSTHVVHMPWAYFFAPPQLREKKVRRSPFAFWRVAPALGSFSDHEEDEEKLRDQQCEEEEEEEEKEILLACLGQIGKINDWIGHVVGRIGQFLQG